MHSVCRGNGLCYRAGWGQNCSKVPVVRATLLKIHSGKSFQLVDSSQNERCACSKSSRTVTRQMCLPWRLRKQLKAALTVSDLCRSGDFQRSELFQDAASERLVGTPTSSALRSYSASAQATGPGKPVKDIEGRELARTLHFGDRPNAFAARVSHFLSEGALYAVVSHHYVATSRGRI